MPSAGSGPEPEKTSPPRLKRGPRSISAEEAAEHQKARLREAIVVLVARDGFAALTLANLVGTAGVSKSTFYEHFADKEDCFLQTFDAIIERVSLQVVEAFRRPGNYRERLVAALSELVDLVLADPAAARFVTVESLSLGAAGIAHREQAAAGFQAMVRRSLDNSRSRVEVSDVVIRGIVAGIRDVIARQLRANKAEALPGMVPELADWALAYRRQPNAAIRAAMRAAAEAPTRPAGDSSFQGADSIPWEEPPTSERSRARLEPRERIQRAAAQLVVERGYTALSIPAISSAAGISNATFYSNFTSKRDAFLAAFATITSQSLRVAGEALRARGGGPEGIGAAVRALLEFFAERELLARVAFVELATAGPTALDAADEIFDRFSAFRRPGAALKGFDAPLSEPLAHGVASAVWAAVGLEVVNGRTRSLPEIAPEITLLTTGPLNRPSSR
jgi:AcrR family transcriptional regulator